MPEIDPCPTLILAPSGRDASIAAAMLTELKVLSQICRNVEHLSSLVSDRTCCVVATEEALVDADLHRLSTWINTQPAWSDLPFVVLTRRASVADRAPAVRLVKTLGNVTLIERPFHPATFASVVGTAIRGRNRQFDARTRIEQVHEGEARLQTALTAGQLGSWDLDLSTGVLTTSATCKAIFGYPADSAFTYQTLLASIHPDDRDRMQATVKSSVETGCDYIIEYRNVWPDRTIHWVDIRARVLSDEIGRAYRLVGVSSDVTARKTAEEGMRQANEALEMKVTQRTAELLQTHQKVLDEIRQREQTEELLRHIQKLETLGQLSGGIAHDFNNLLMAIIANLELARKEVPQESRLMKLIDGAFGGARRGAALTQRLLAFARQQELKVEPVAMSSLIAGMSDLVQRSIGSSIELVIRSDSTSPQTMVDANQVELAVLNLVINARDAMPNGGTLSISVDTAEASGALELHAGQYVRVTVSDTGTGMDPATLARATEPFFTTKEVGKGTGLGLSMVHGLALQLGGSLRLESSPGRGTHASLLLPVSEAQTSHALPPVTLPARQSEVIDPLHERACVLVVDDDPLIASSTAFLLEDLGHEVVEVHSGVAALDVLHNGKHIDLILTDYSMPRMTGLELAHAARGLRPSLPVVIATGYAELPEGADHTIPRIRKPYLQEQLIAEIRKALHPRST
ncbi:hybrid sensor histidine kinase/response regulator [Caballeronia sp. ATUFL_M2_KS44]|uniref:PAS domain-containing hybrid sensor histidine kinase/response regulator n=1 Tax=Caballeronia sp. ATUFL_M2_KS44 TaxID=2921767 RepID=UPI0025417DA3|nr:hybrid sensor histidine kinase/response regulator [Caballeronia sp. ATUFL_M2_KS44]